MFFKAGASSIRGEFQHPETVRAQHEDPSGMPRDSPLFQHLLIFASFAVRVNKNKMKYHPSFFLTSSIQAICLCMGAAKLFSSAANSEAEKRFDDNSPARNTATGSPGSVLRNAIILNVLEVLLCDSQHNHVRERILLLK